jgi:hypothetical protein
VLRRFVVASAAVFVFAVGSGALAGCGGDDTVPRPEGLATTTVPQGATDTNRPTAADNPFIPTDVDLSECLGTLPRPGCGSDERGGWRQYLTFAILMLAMALIGWRVFHAAAQRDRAIEAAGQRQTPAMSTTNSDATDDDTQP